MIAQLTGQVSYRGERFAIITTGGVGYCVFMSTESLRTLPATASAVKLWTYLAVRENALDLYGFVSKEEHDFFTLLISVSGIGPKSAIAILSLAPPAVLRKAVAAGDSAYLTKVSGIGRKSAEKIVLELKDKIGDLSGSSNQEHLSGEAEAIEALQALGYSLREAREALKGVPAETDTGEKVKSALKQLGKK